MASPSASIPPTIRPYRAATKNILECLTRPHVRRRLPRCAQHPEVASRPTRLAPRAGERDRECVAVPLAVRQPRPDLDRRSRERVVAPIHPAATAWPCSAASLRSGGFRRAVRPRAYEDEESSEKARERREPDGCSKVHERDAEPRDAQALRSHDVSRARAPRVTPRSVVALHDVTGACGAADDAMDHEHARSGLPFRDSIGDDVADVVAAPPYRQDEVAAVERRIHAVPRDDHVGRASMQEPRPDEQRTSDDGCERREARDAPGRAATGAAQPGLLPIELQCARCHVLSHRHG